MAILVNSFKCSIVELLKPQACFRPAYTLTAVRYKSREVDLPSNVGPRAGRFRRIVHYPDEYTIKPLKVTRLGGRDPVSGRLVVKGIGGGIKREYHWIQWKRDGPSEGPPRVDKVFEIMIDWCRTAHIALIGGGSELMYILATENMKPGDLIKTSRQIPRIPVSPNEGDAYPLGALSVGTLVNNIEQYPRGGGYFVHAAGSFATITRKVGSRVIIQLPSKQEVSLSKECLATVGRLSNVEHINTPIGSAQRNRELGNRPRSGLWHRKDGRFGRKIYPPPPLLVKKEGVQKAVPEILTLTVDNELRQTTKFM